MVKTLKVQIFIILYLSFAFRGLESCSRNRSIGAPGEESEVRNTRRNDDLEHDEKLSANDSPGLNPACGRTSGVRGRA